MRRNVFRRQKFRCQVDYDSLVFSKMKKVSTTTLDKMKVRKKGERKMTSKVYKGSRIKSSRKVAKSLLIGFNGLEV